MAEIKCMPLKSTTDGPLFGRPEGTLSALTNMRLRPGGYAEARGGFEEDKPNGGTPADAITAGGYSAVHQISSSFGWVRTYDKAAGAGSQYSENLQFDPGAWPAFPTGIVDDALYLGADLPFSRVAVNLVTAGAWAAITLVYEYWNGSDFNTALTTAETIDFTYAGLNSQYASWTMPTNWAATAIGDSGTGNVYKYWMRIRISSITTLATLPRVTLVTGVWSGNRETYVATQSPRTTATSGTLKRQGQNGTTREWFSVSSSLFAGNASPTRMASYRGRIFLVNGKEAKRWDGSNLSNIGLPKVDSTSVTFVLAPAAFGATGIPPGLYRYWAAWGYGPMQSPGMSNATRLFDPKPMYGAGEALYIGEQTVAAPNQQINITVTGTIPADASIMYIYRTQDLTNVSSSRRGNFPAYAIGHLYRTGTGTNIATNMTAMVTGGAVNIYADVDTLVSSSAQFFPQIEAIQYSTLPPDGCRYVAVYQNRILLGTNDQWFWSDAFLPDSFNKATQYIQLARAQGGRHMNGIEFADQMVLYTEDQTWGLTNIDLDVPQLYPIHPSVGCIAPDAIATGDGVLIWPGKDGFYMWAGGRTAPVNISGDWDTTFGKMSFENHGGSRAVINDRQYIVRLCAPGGTPGSAYAFDIDTGQWSTFDNLASFGSVLSPLATIHAPLGNNDAGAPHTIWGKTDYTTSAGEYGLFLGELTTQDAGTNYQCSAYLYFPVPPSAVFSPRRVLAYYQASGGWGTPTLSNAATVIGTSVGTINTGTPDTGTDYSVVGGTYSQVGRGASDIQVSFAVSSAAGGTVNGQRLFGALLNGEYKAIRRGMV